MTGSVTARFWVRAALATLLAGLGSLGTAIIDNSVSPGEWVGIATVTVAALAAWLGVGATTNMEPYVGVNKTPDTVPPSRI